MESSMEMSAGTMLPFASVTVTLLTSSCSVPPITTSLVSIVS
jgi:hypothetical protein